MKEQAHIRVMTPRDVDYMKRCVDAELWGVTREELGRVQSYEPNGCFVAESNGTPMGTVTTTCYGSLAWIGYLIVDQRARGRGIGVQLMQMAIGYLEERGVETIRLDATPSGTPLYQRLGFVDECRSLRFQGQGRPGIDPRARLAEPGDQEAIQELDHQAFGGDRSRVILRLLRDCPRRAFVVRAAGSLAGFILGKETEDGVRLGPWIVRPGPQSTQVAQHLLRAGLGAAGDCRVHVGTLEDQRLGRNILERNGFREAFYSRRMRRGPPRHFGQRESTLGIGSPGKG